MLTREPLDELIARMRLLKVDHGPDGWPAVQMRDITALLAEIDRRFGIQSWLAEARRERDELRRLLLDSQLCFDAARERIGKLEEICQSAHDRLLRGDSDQDLMALLETSWKGKA